MGKKTEVVPPSAPEIEASIIGAILIDSDAIVKVMDLIDKDSFFTASHKMIFDAMTDLFNRNIPIDTVTVYNELNRREQLEEVGGAVYLSRVSQNIPSSANIEYHAKIIAEKAILRNLIRVSNDTTTLCYQHTMDAFEIIEKAENQIFNVTQQNYKKYHTIQQSTHLLMEHIDQAKQGKSGSLSTGFIDLDRLLNGFAEAQYYVLAARPSIGKTALALKMAKSMAKEAEVFFVSIEMSELHIVTRLLSTETRIGFNQILSGNFPKERNQDVIDAGRRISKLKITIDDSSNISITELRSKCKRLKIEKDIKAVFVDYLQLMEAKAETREREISIISKGLKAIAKDLNIPVIALSQLNRSCEARNDKRPNLSDLRESGSIEQDADGVMLLYRPEYYQMKTFKDGSNSDGQAEVIVAKNRNGAVGSAYLQFDKGYADFNNLATNHNNEKQDEVVMVDTTEDLPF